MAETLRNLREIAPTVYFNVPTGFEAIAHAMETDALLRKNLLSRVRMFFYAGAALAQPVWDSLHRTQEAEIGERIVMGTGLGMTESGPFALYITSPDVQLRRPRRCRRRAWSSSWSTSTARPRCATAAPTSRRATGARPRPRAEAFDEEGFFCTGDAVQWIDDARHPPRPALRRPHRRRLQARHRHLRERRPAAREDHRGRRALRAGRGAHRHQPEGSRRADLPDAGACASWPACRPTRRCSRCSKARRCRRTSSRCSTTLAASSHRQRQPHRARAPDGRAALDRQGRSHRQGLDQPARRAQAPRGAGRGPARRTRCPSRSSPLNHPRRHTP